MIRTIACLPFFFVAVVGTGITQDKKAETIFYPTTAEDIAKEFGADAKKAAKKYNPKPPIPGGAGGAVIGIKGKLDKAKGMDLYLDGTPAIRVLLKAKKLDGKANVGATVEGTGIFKGFTNNVVIIEIDTAKISPGL